jgi:hypothetical protein
VIAASRNAREMQRVIPASNGDARSTQNSAQGVSRDGLVDRALHDSGEVVMN